ncbi:TetR/AcrR family transcriptional regulator [Kutzneria sp. CA-103260]|uniref:TetR/AcrR family transcriptional regulator n=1 Tax=Kutzneria sp. CA-103260 TaxID=2802641 RepID=UPI001BA5D430|nr:TetR family transcriptional regulator [Kutzneria sp. CA-103260]
MTTAKRVRDPEAKRAAILAAARSVFAEHGYDKATIRQIAERAGVTHGLVMMHFATKAKLFVAAVPAQHLADKVVGDVEGLPERVARAYVERMTSAEGCNPFIALVRGAATDQDDAKSLLRAMRETSVEIYRGMLDDEDVPQRADMLGALFMGVAYSRHVLADGPIAAMTPDELIRYMTRAIRAILLGHDNI